jgi:hypothetical protein
MRYEVLTAVTMPVLFLRVVTPLDLQVDVRFSVEHTASIFRAEGGYLPWAVTISASLRMLRYNTVYAAGTQVVNPCTV